jgi:dCMP deaminase
MSERWDNHFLQSAFDEARMSKDPSTRVGAVIVGPDREKRATGFNGFPRGVLDTPERLNDREMKLRLTVHAEMNAVLNAARAGTSVKGCALYFVATDNSNAIWGGAPCTRCSVELIQAGIVEVVSIPFKNTPSRWADDVAFAETVLEEAGVVYREVKTFKND